MFSCSGEKGFSRQKENCEKEYSFFSPVFHIIRHLPQRGQHGAGRGRENWCNDAAEKRCRVYGKGRVVETRDYSLLGLIFCYSHYFQSGSFDPDLIRKAYYLLGSSCSENDTEYANTANTLALRYTRCRYAKLLIIDSPAKLLELPAHTFTDLINYTCCSRQ